MTLRRIGKIDVQARVSGNDIVSTGFVFYSYAKNSNALEFHFKDQQGKAVDLLGTTVRLLLIIKEGGTEKEFKTLDEEIVTESSLNGIVRYIIPDRLMGYQGIVDGWIYFDFPDGSKTDEVHFKFTIERSKIDDAFLDAGDFYIKDFEEIKNQVNQSATEAMTLIDSTKAEFSALVAVLADANKFRTDIDTLETKKADKTDVNQALNQVNDRISNIPKGNPSGVYATLVALKTAFPNGNSNIYVVTADGKWYYWNGSEWVAGGIYQAIELAEKSITEKELADTVNVSENLVNPYKITQGKYVNASNGVIYDGISSTGLNVITEMLDVTPDEKYYLNLYHNCAGYDSNGIFVYNFSVGTNRVITIPDGVYKIRCSFKQEDLNRFMISKGSAPFDYQPFVFQQKYQASNNFDSFDYISWEIGSISSSSGSNVNILTRLRSGAVRMEENTVIKTKIKNGKYLIALAAYDENGNFVEMKKGLSEKLTEIKITNSGIYRILLAYYDNRSIENSEELINQLVIEDSTHTNFHDYMYSAQPLTLNSTISAIGNELVGWDFGTVNVAQPYGNLYNESRICVKNVLLTPGQTILLEDITSLKMQILKYDLSNTFLSAPVYLNANLSSYTVSDVGYYTIILAKKDDSVISDIVEMSKKIRIYNTSSETDIIGQELGNLVKVDYRPEITGNFSSHCFVKDEFWCFSAADYSETGPKGKCYRYSIADDLSMTLLGTFEHNWNHVNSVSYSAFSDTLTCTSFVGDSTPESEKKYHIYLFEEASSFTEKTEVLIADHALVIDVGSKDWGRRMNSCFGEGNSGKGNIIYYITNDNCDVRKLLLGKGTNDLGDGQFREGKTDEQFNGSFKILAEYHDSLGGLEVNQGSCYYGGLLYLGLGHEGLYYQITKLNDDGSITKKAIRDTLYDNTGEIDKPNYGFSGITVTKDYIICGLQAGNIYFYER